jgi:hypothetical protein
VGIRCPDHATPSTRKGGGRSVGIVHLRTTATGFSLVRNWWNDWQGKLKYLEKICPSAALSTTKLTCCPEAKPGRRRGKPAINRLSYGTANLTINENSQHRRLRIPNFRLSYEVVITLSSRILLLNIKWACFILHTSRIASLYLEFIK